MDWFDLLLILFFIVLPLLQQLLERWRRPPGLPPTEEAPENRERPEPSARRLPQPEPDWSEGWGSWPSPTAEELSAEEVVTEEQAVELSTLQEVLSAEEVPEAVRVSVPVVSLESLVVDRSAPQSRALQPSGQRAVPAPPKFPPRVAALLGGRRELRRVILLSEVLGPPRGLR